jgi:3-hydroxybutyrate dehydrogenase
VNCICPGYVWTELIERQLASSAASRGMTEDQLISEVLLRPQPIGRFVNVSEVAGLARYLCSDEAAAVTGAVLSIDGGWTAQ